MAPIRAQGYYDSIAKTEEEEGSGLQELCRVYNGSTKTVDGSTKTVDGSTKTVELSVHPTQKTLSHIVIVLAQNVLTLIFITFTLT